MSDFEINSSQSENNTVNPAIALQGMETSLTPGSQYHGHYSPVICGDLVCWIYKNGYQYSLEIYNLTTGIEISGPLNRTKSGFSDPPALYQDKVVYMDVYNNRETLFLLNATSQNITHLPVGIDGSDQFSPAIFGNNVVYTDDRNGDYDIYLYNLINQTEQILTPGTEGTNQEGPAICQQNVIWYDERYGTSAIFLYNITENTTQMVIPDTGDIRDIQPAIWGNYIAWSDDRYQNYDIYLLNITSGKETVLTPATNDTDQTNPSINNNFVVWEDQQNPGGHLIKGMDLTTGLQYDIDSDPSGSDKITPKISGNRIVWQDNRNGYWNIYMFTIGETSPPVSANFSANVTICEVPFTVHFTDMSTGNPVGYAWDFGDGNISYDKNPVYTYYNPGIYTVQETVSTSWSRDAKDISGYITAGTVPTAQFSANPPSGPMPLTVTFCDTSTGQPTVWQWDFGDNSTSDEQNPVHSYNSAGNYSVKLACGNQYGNNTIQNSVLVVPATSTNISLKIPGEVFFAPDSGLIIIDENSSKDYQYNLYDNGSQLDIIPINHVSGFKIILFSSDSIGFIMGNGIISGNLTSMSITSDNISSSVFYNTAGTGSWVNITSDINEYNPSGSLDMVVSNQITPYEYQDTIRQYLMPSTLIP